MTAIEKVARAICQSQGCDPDAVVKGTIHIDGYNPRSVAVMPPMERPQWKYFENDARAAIKASDERVRGTG